MTLDIYLVHPVFLSHSPEERELMSPYFPLGLLYLAAFLREQGFTVDIFDGTFRSGPQEFAAELERRQPRAVGIGVAQPNREMALEMAQMARTHGAQVILGGPDPTVRPERYAFEPGVDWIVHHEGELTLAELLNALLCRAAGRAEIGRMKGIAYRSQSGELVVNPRRQYILDLDELPLPARDLIDMDAYLQTWREMNGYASLTISVARGCPYGCRWCADSVHGQEQRRRSPHSVAREVKALMQRYPIDRLRVVDDVDGLDREWLDAWEQAARAENAVIPFEALNDLQRKDIPMLDVRDSL